MKVVLFCGGQGTRLREETEYRPKPLVEVGGRPILWHIMKIFAHYGINDFVLCLGYKGSNIKEYFLNYEAMNNDFTIRLGKGNQVQYHNMHGEQDFTVTLANTGLETMTGGRLKQVSKYIDDEIFMVSYGDGVANIDISSLIEFHRSHGKIATVTAVRPFSRFGVLNISDREEVVDFTEKPQIDSWASVGFFVFNRKIFNYLGGDDCILEQEPLQKLAENGQLMAYRHHGFFYAMDTYREYKYLNELWESKNAPWKVWP
ncbi:MULTISPECIES: glucose-1-phosphate cytidylyltransferase [Pseudanabaena]|uniref:Glucose-1-phosphate cytidylyltransferase n=2 Tax=Pseudanabaena TaxID=1152 RepID=L8N1K2_9CYAN|nr:MULTISPECIES: glucose-1-phosphate cytidylyltransferase [Pseudanabaena]ELS33596.1 glucose-1-phosphate cytidylyltransferase [Pseudanabaena biceps PCC 7429]MDG3494198.1 glucose-1-phosphate cytidylyltransferase [Pseudanabaena catenata USMAC16]